MVIEQIPKNSLIGPARFVLFNKLLESKNYIFLRYEDVIENSNFLFDKLKHSYRSAWADDTSFWDDANRALYRPTLTISSAIGPDFLIKRCSFYIPRLEAEGPLIDPNIC